MAVKIIRNGKGTLLSDEEWGYLVDGLEEYLDDDNPEADDNYQDGTWDRETMDCLNGKVKAI